MKRSTKFLILVGVLALVLGAFFLFTNLMPEEGGATDGTASQVIFSLDPAKVTNFGWKYTDQVNFTKTENGWVNDADSTFPVDGAFLQKMLEALKEISAVKTIDTPSADLEQYGLANPYCTVTVTVDGTTHNLVFGAQNEFNGQLYFSKGDGKVYMINSAISDAIYVKPEQALLLETIPNLSKLNGLKVEHGDKTYEILLQEDSGKTYSDHYKWFWNGETALDTELTEEMLSVIYDLAWKGCATHNATDLAPYGLDNATVITVTYDTDKTFVLHLGDRTDKGLYARIGESNMVCYVGYSIGDTLRNLSAEELKPDEVLAMDWEKVKGADITLGGKTYTLVYEEVPDPNGCATGTYTWKYDGKEIAANTVMEKLEKIETTGYATGLTPDQAEEVRFLFHCSSANFAEVELVIYAYTSTECLVTLNGVSTVKADRSDVTSLINELNKLFPAA